MAIFTDIATTTVRTFSYTVEQDVFKIYNSGNTDLYFNVGKYTNIVLHTKQTWENLVDYMSFDIHTKDKDCSFDIITTVLGTTLATVGYVDSKVVSSGGVTQGQLDVVASSLTDIMQWQNKKGVALGDSMTAGYGSSGQEYTEFAGYIVVVKSKLKLTSYTNMGVEGVPMANGTANGSGTNTKGKTVDYTNVDLVTIFAGTNDLKLNVALGTQGIIGDTTFDNTKFYGAYRELIEYILIAKPNIRIVLYTPIQRDNGGATVNTTNSVGSKLIDYVNAIKNIGQMYGIPVLDLYSQSGITKLTLSTLTIDGLHPNDVGYARIGNLMSKFLNNI